jgi:hypothetical protein
VLSRHGEVLQGRQGKRFEGAQGLVRHSQDDARGGGIHAREVPRIEQRQLRETDQGVFSDPVLCGRLRFVNGSITCGAAPVGAIIEAGREE